MLQVETLSLVAGERSLIEALSFDAAAGQVWAVLGPNGSGKSTLLHTLAGIRTTHSGAVRLTAPGAAPQPVHALAPRALARRLALLPQREQGSTWGSVFDYVILARYAYADALTPEAQQRVHSALEDVQLSALAQRAMHTLSGGEFQRARIAQIWAQDAAIMCLDEPLQHLDPQHQLRFMQRCAQLASEARRLIFIVMHDSFWALRYCTHALLVYGDGRTATGDAAQLLTPAHLAQLYGVDQNHFNSAAR